MQNRKMRKNRNFSDSARGEAVVVLMAAMMIGGFLVWLIAGHHSGMHGRNHEGADSRPAAVVSPEKDDLPARNLAGTDGVGYHVRNAE